MRWFDQSIAGQGFYEFGCLYFRYKYKLDTIERKNPDEPICSGTRLRYIELLEYPFLTHAKENLIKRCESHECDSSRR